VKEFFGNALNEYIQHHVCEKDASLRHAQERILYGVLGISSVVLLFPYLIGVVLAGRIGLWPVVIVDTISYGGLLFLVFSSSITYRTRVYGVLLVIEFLALSLLVITGNQGAGWLWLFLAPILAALLLDCRNGYLVSVTSTLILAVMAAVNLMMPSDQLALLEDGLALFVVIISNYLTLSMVLVFIIGRLLNSLEGTLEALWKGTRELELTQEVTVDTMASLAEYRDIETGNHIIRTRHYVQLLARQLQSQSPDGASLLDDETAELLSRSAPLHDIGKVGVPDDILLKPGRLTADEFEEMKQHTRYGRDALMHAEEKLGSNHFLRLAAEIAWTHHEKWDGSGYPRGLSGDQIPLPGRIMAVADVYDALISRRVYKEASSHEEALAYIVDHAGCQFDPEVVRALQVVAEEFRIVAQEFSDR
jgi:HD-GYP domain-containing protein (c-di-GMP phosphodiesterase class II)